MNIFVTGGTGFLGEHLISAIQAEGGHTLYGLARSESSAKTLEERGVSPVRADLTDGDALRRALEPLTVEVVFHLAAEIATQRSKSKLRSANIDGTQRLFEAVRLHEELKTFVFASTVVTGQAHGALLVEDRPLVVETEYGRTKQTAEKILLDAQKAEGFPAIVLRPCHIYGDGGWFGGIIQELKKGALRMPGDGKNMWDVVHVDDVAQGCLALLHHGEPGEIYHVADDTPVTMGEFVQEAARRLDVKPPGWVPRALASMALGKDTISSVMRSARTSNAKLKGLGWNPQYPDYKSGLAQALGTSTS